MNKRLSAGQYQRFSDRLRDRQNSEPVLFQRDARGLALRDAYIFVEPFQRARGVSLRRTIFAGAIVFRSSEQRINRDSIPRL
jgi:hypothetical protein